MSEKIQLAIFDLDGTLLDTLADLADSVNFALSVFGYPSRTYEEIRGFVGDGIRKLIERSVPEGTEQGAVDEVHRVFLKQYKEHCADKTKPYDGVSEVLECLRRQGIKTAVVSNKADAAVKELCNKYFPKLFDASVGEREGVARKPAPDSVNEILNLLSVNRLQAVYIGDSDVDIRTAENAGMACISVDWGFRDRECLKASKAMVIISNPRELPALIGLLP